MQSQLNESRIDALVERLCEPSNSGAACKVLVLEAADALVALLPLLEQQEARMGEYERALHPPVTMEWTEYEDSLHRMKPAEQSLQPWLLGDGHGEAKYTVAYDEHGNYWMAKWWHGNRGYSADGWWHHRTKEEAKEACRKHLERMRAGLYESLTHKKVDGERA